MNDEFDDLMDEAIENIRSDRKAAREFLNELANQIAQNAENNRALSPVAAFGSKRVTITPKEIIWQDQKRKN